MVNFCKNPGMLRPHRRVVLALVLFAPGLACKANDKANDETNDKTNDETKPAARDQALDISSIDPALTGKLMIDVPPGSELHPAGPGNVVISGLKPELFELLISVEPRDLDIWRDDPDHIVLDEPDLVIFSVEVGEGKRDLLTFSSNVKVGERVFGCVPNTEAFADRAYIDPMIAACRSLRIE
jgi:hypothetical protein